MPIPNGLRRLRLIAWAALALPALISVAILARLTIVAGWEGFGELPGQLTDNGRVSAAFLRTLMLGVVAVAIEIGAALTFASFAMKRLSGAMAVLCVLPMLIGAATLSLTLLLTAQFDVILGRDGGTVMGALIRNPEITLVALDVWQWSPALALLLALQQQRLDPTHFAVLRLMGGSQSRASWLLLGDLWGATIALFAAFRLLDWLRLTESAQLLFGSGGPNQRAELFASYLAKATYWPQSQAGAMALGVLIVLVLALTIRLFIAPRLLRILVADAH